MIRPQKKQGLLIVISRLDLTPPNGQEIKYPTNNVSETIVGLIFTCT